MKIFQDGSNFVNDETGDDVYRSCVYVRDDCDWDAVERAREDFLNWFSRERPNDKLEWA